MKIDSLTSLDGRQFLREFFFELRYERQLSGLTSLFRCLKVCIDGREIGKYTRLDVTVIHQLGVWRGGLLWLEEVLNRFYFTTINSFVYFGAAILLVLIGIRRFSDSISDTAVILGIVFEALMLVLMFLVMLFSPNEENVNNNTSSDETSESTEELLIEIGEISRDFAATVVQLEQVGDTMKSISEKQDLLVENLSEIAKSTALAVAPNPELIVIMKQVNESLSDFGAKVSEFNRTAGEMKREQIEAAVRKEIESFFSDRINKS